MEVPSKRDDVSAAWLTSALRDAGLLPRGEVRSVGATDLAGAPGMTGDLARLRPHYDAPHPEAPTSLVVKLSAPDAGTRALVHGMGFYEREVRFYQRLAPQTPVATPRVFWGAVDEATGASVLLLEDLAPACTADLDAGCSLTQTDLVVRTLARLHARWWEDALLDDLDWLVLRGPVSVRSVHAAFTEAWPLFLDKLRPAATEEVLEVGAWLLEAAGDVSAALFDEPPRTLVHNDCTVENLFFDAPGSADSVTVIDWQLATLGRGVVDLAWFLGGNVDPVLRRAHEHALLRTYHALLGATGVTDYPFERCLDDYRLAMLMPAARVAMAVGMQPHLTADAGGSWNVAFRRYCRAARDLEVGDLLVRRRRT